MVSHISRRGFLKSLALAGGAVAGGALLSACGGGAATPAAAPAAAPVTLEVGSKGDELAYDKTTLEAPAGSKITLKLKNNASEASGNKHNWVLTKTADADAVAIDGISAGEANSQEKPGDALIIAARRSDRYAATGNHHRLWLRRAGSRQGARRQAGGRHRDRPLQPSPVSAATVSSRHRRLVGAVDRRADPPHAAQAAQ